MNKLLFLIILTVSLVACQTGVKLDTPVEDATASTQNAGAGGGMNNQYGSNGASGQQAGAGGVTTVDLGASGGANAGPSNVGKVVYFDYDSYLIKPEYASVIEGHVKFLSSRKSVKITVEGHTDATGGREYNLALGQKRAEAVRRAMMLAGLADAQIEAVSFGKEKPAALGSDETSMAKNRRAEVSYR